MKSLLMLLALVFALSFTSCGDDDEPDTVCLVCTSDDPDITVEGDRVCEGDTDPDTGETITRADLDAAKALIEAFGADCTLD
jgi:hypothetical protein